MAGRRPRSKHGGLDVQIPQDSREREIASACKRQGAGFLELAVAIRLNEYDEAGILTSELTGHTHERTLWRIWKTYKHHPLLNARACLADSEYLDKLGLPKK